MKTKTVFMMLAVITPLIVVAITQITVTSVSAQTENMTMEELTNASLAQYPDTMENETTMEEETSALVGNITGNMTGQNMTIGNMTG
jgi:sortase (surface protein transpeptidase)